MNSFDNTFATVPTRIGLLISTIEQKVELILISSVLMLISSRKKQNKAERCRAVQNGAGSAAYLRDNHDDASTTPHDATRRQLSEAD